jgi:hypothetical protein
MLILRITAIRVDTGISTVPRGVLDILQTLGEWSECFVKDLLGRTLVLVHLTSKDFRTLQFGGLSIKASWASCGFILHRIQAFNRP